MRSLSLFALLLAGCLDIGDNTNDLLPDPIPDAPAARCGDGTKNTNEACDDGNTTSGDGCSATCTIETATPECGNGVREGSEACDDGNTTSGDGCSATCSVEVHTPECGDGVVEGTEACDDGNTTSGDGCSASCTIEASIAPTVIFSEYVEGSGFNKAIEIKNPGNAPFDLEANQCILELYSNGAATPSQRTTLEPLLELGAGEVIVLCHASASQGLLDLCDYTASAVAFTGDDVIAIRCGTELVDAIGQIGMDPGTSWGAGNTSTADHTLIRDCDVTAGDTDGENAYDVSGWSGFAIDTFDGLGDPTCAN